MPGLSNPNSFNLVYLIKKKKINIDETKNKKLFLKFFDFSLFSVNKYAITKKNINFLNSCPMGNIQLIMQILRK